MQRVTVLGDPSPLICLVWCGEEPAAPGKTPRFPESPRRGQRPERCCSPPWLTAHPHLAWGASMSYLLLLSSQKIWEGHKPCGLKGPQNLTVTQRLLVDVLRSHIYGKCEVIPKISAVHQAGVSPAALRSFPASAECLSPLSISWMLASLPQESIVPARTGPFSLSLTPLSPTSRWQP